MTQNTKDAGASTWAPDRIWLQREQGEGGSHTWCEDSVGDGDLIEEVEYVRADLAPTAEQAKGATPDEVIDLAVALEQERALHIVAAVRKQGFSKSASAIPTQAEALFDLACEEIEHRLRTETWELDGVALPLPAAPAQSAEPVEQPEELPESNQDWTKVSASVAFHLIERHSENWDHAGALMEEWREATSAAPQPSETAVVLDAGRAAFEAWGNETFNYGFQPETWKEGTGPVASEPQYAHEGTQMAWEGWQARAASPQATATLTVADIIAIAEDCSAKDGHLDVPAFRNELLSAGGRK